MCSLHCMSILVSKTTAAVDRFDMFRRRFCSIFASISWIFQPPGQYGGRAVHLGSFGSKHLGFRTQDDRVIQSLQMRATSNGSIDCNPHTVSGLSGQEAFKFRKLMHLILDAPDPWIGRQTSRWWSIIAGSPHEFLALWRNGWCNAWRNG